MRIAILGAGGVGSYYGGTLARVGHQVTFLARGAHLAALRERGLDVQTPEAAFTVPSTTAEGVNLGVPIALTATGDPQALLAGAVPELAIVAVKGYSLAEVAPVARRLAEAGAVVLPLLNGVEAADRLIAAGVPAGQVLGGLTQVSAVRTRPGVVQLRSPFQIVIVGEREGGWSRRADDIAAAFRETGADARASANITADLWRKWMFFSALAAACGLARATVGAVRQAPLGGLFLERAVREVGAVGRARGVALAGDDEEKVLANINGLPGEMRPSFLLDLEAGGPNELDDLSGAVSRLGRESGVATPVHDTATAALGAVRPAS